MLLIRLRLGALGTGGFFDVVDLGAGAGLNKDLIYPGKVSLFRISCFNLVSNLNGNNFAIYYATATLHVCKSPKSVLGNREYGFFPVESKRAIVIALPRCSNHSSVYQGASSCKMGASSSPIGATT